MGARRGRNGKQTRVDVPLRGRWCERKWPSLVTGVTAGMGRGGPEKICEVGRTEGDGARFPFALEAIHNEGAEVEGVLPGHSLLAALMGRIF